MPTLFVLQKKVKIIEKPYITEKSFPGYSLFCSCKTKHSETDVSNLSAVFLKGLVYFFQ